MQTIKCAVRCVQKYTERRMSEWVEPEMPFVMPERIDKLSWLHDFQPMDGYHRCLVDLSYADAAGGSPPARVASVNMQMIIIFLNK